MHDYPGAVPCLHYGNPAAAADWITQVLGFREAPGQHDVVDQVELERDGAVLLLVLGPSGGQRSGTSSHTRVIVDDVDDACLRALCAGGAVESSPMDDPVGLRQPVVSDPEGNRWELTDRASRRV